MSLLSLLSLCLGWLRLVAGPGIWRGFPRSFRRRRFRHIWSSARGTGGTGIGTCGGRAVWAGLLFIPVSGGNAMRYKRGSSLVQSEASESFVIHLKNELFLSLLDSFLLICPCPAAPLPTSPRIIFYPGIFYSARVLGIQMLKKNHSLKSTCFDLVLGQTMLNYLLCLWYTCIPVILSWGCGHSDAASRACVTEITITTS